MYSDKTVIYILKRQVRMNSVNDLILNYLGQKLSKNCNMSSGLHQSVIRYYILNFSLTP